MKELDVRNVLLGYFSKDVAKSRILDSDLLVVMNAKKGDKEAIRKIIESNIRLVVKFASRFTVQSDVFMDLINEGCIGIMRAIRKYDPLKGVKFSSYASIWVKHFMLKFLSEQNLLKIPLRKKRLLKSLALYKGVGKFSEENNIDVWDYISISSCNNVLLYSDLGYCEEFKFVYGSTDDVEEFINNEYISFLVKEKVSRLSPKEKFIIEHRFGLDGRDEKSLGEIARILGTTPEGVRYIEQKALRKLKKMLQNENVESII